MPKDLLTRLRTPEMGWSGDAFCVGPDTAAEAADKIESNAKVIAALREALGVAHRALNAHLAFQYGPAADRAVVMAARDTIRDALKSNEQTMPDDLSDGLPHLNRNE